MWFHTFFSVQAIFTDKEITQTRFQRLKRDPAIVNQQVSIEQLTNLDERLQIVMTTSEERGRHLEFEQIHWQVQGHVGQLEDLMKLFNKKQGDIQETEELVQLYRVGISDRWTRSRILRSAREKSRTKN